MVQKLLIVGIVLYVTCWKSALIVALY